MQAELRQLLIAHSYRPAHNFRMGLNLRIRQLRKDRGLTLEQLAARIHVSAPHLSEVERGKKNLNNHLIERLADALGVPHTDLIGADEAQQDFSRLRSAMKGLSEADQARVEAFALALLSSQTDSPQAE